MEVHGSAVPTPERARRSSWGGPEVWAELRRLTEEARKRADFHVSAIEVLRGDGLLELVAFAGGTHESPDVGNSFSFDNALRVLEEGTSYGRFVFLPEERMDPQLREALRGYGYVPAESGSQDPRRWRALDMLVAPLVDGMGRIRGLLHLDEPSSGLRPHPAEFRALAEELDVVLEAALAMVDRDELTRRARLDETARTIGRSVSQQLDGHELVTAILPELVRGFRASSVAVWFFDDPSGPQYGTGAARALPTALWPSLQAAALRSWDVRGLTIVEPGRVWGDERLGAEHADDLTRFLAVHDAGELLLVPVGVGEETMGALIVVRDGRDDRWTEGESTAALGVSQDLGRALLSTRAREREQQLIGELRRLDDYRRDLILTVAHEVQNPLGVIVGHVEMLESVSGLTADAATSLRALQRGASRLASVVDDLLLLGQADDPHVVASKDAVDLDRLAAEVIEDASLYAAQQQVSLRSFCPGQPVAVEGNEEELRRVLANLLSNAVKYSDAGDTVDLSIVRAGAEVTLTCRDTGIGISEADTGLLFTEFFRTSNPAALKRPGTGLGLAIVHRIVLRHRGTIEVESELGAGTTVRVTLPAVPDE